MSLAEADLSLGWSLVHAWYELFPSPRDEEQPFLLTDDQVETIVGWYRVHPRTGQFVYRRGCSRRSKGSGKSPIEAAKCISELKLDVRFDHWAARGETSPWGYQYQPGEPVGRPWGTKGDPAPWIQIASLSEDQDENTYSPLYYFLTARDGYLADELRIDAGLTRCLLRDRPDAKIEPVTSRAGSREGQPITYATLDESGLMTATNGGVKLARTIRRNAGKMGGRTYETTNGFMPGEGSVAEGTQRSVDKGSPGIFYDAVEAPTHIDGVEVNEAAPDSVLLAALQVAYGDAWWVPLDRIVADIRDPDMPWQDSERYFFNWNRKSEGQAFDPNQWALLARPVAVRKNTLITLGFDGARFQDSTALVGTVIATGYQWLIGLWERPEDAPPKWEVDAGDVDRAVAEAFAHYKVWRLYADPPYWETTVDAWAGRYGDEAVVSWWTNRSKPMAYALRAYRNAQTTGELSHDGNPDFARHIANARKKLETFRDEIDDKPMWTIRKEHRGSAKKIDVSMAGCLSWEARGDAIAAGVLKPKAKSRIVNLAAALEAHKQKTAEEART